MSGSWFPASPVDFVPVEIAIPLGPRSGSAALLECQPASTSARIDLDAVCRLIAPAVDIHEIALAPAAIRCAPLSREGLGPVSVLTERAAPSTEIPSDDATREWWNTAREASRVGAHDRQLELMQQSLGVGDHILAGRFRIFHEREEVGAARATISVPRPQIRTL